MTKREFLTEGIPLFKVNADKNNYSVFVYTKHYGKVNLLIPAGKNIISKLNSHLEAPAKVELLFIQGKYRKKILSVKQVEFYPKIRSDFLKIKYYLLFIKFFHKLVKYEEKDELLYRFLEYVLSILNNNDFLNELDVKFFIYLMLYRLLKLLAYHHFDYYCAECNNVIKENAFLNLYQGEIICKNCYKAKINLKQYYLLDKKELDILYTLSNANSINLSISNNEKLKFIDLVEKLLNIYL